MTALAAFGAAVLVGALAYQCIELFVLERIRKDIPSRPISGIEAMVDRPAEVVTAFVHPDGTAPARGQVRVSGEIWQAELASGTLKVAAVGDQVRVVGVSGLTLTVTTQ